MNALETREINLWTCTEEEQQEWERQQEDKRAKVAASPKFQYGEKRSKTLLDILLSTPQPKPIASPEQIRAFSASYFLSELRAPSSPTESLDAFNQLIEDEKWRESNRSRQWLGLRVHSYHIEQRRKEPGLDVRQDRSWRQCIETLNDLRTPFRIGSAVAVYERMQRIGIIEPSLSKAHWLLTRAPDVNGTLRAGFGSPDDLARAWKHHYPFAHYWAAYVAMTGEPFSFDPATLVKFICNASLGRFRRLAATYLEFRRDVAPPRSKQKSYINQGLDDYRNVQDIAGAQPIPRERLPNLLNTSQWNALDGYSVRPRKDRA
ncbi:hypothetical protein [Paraburkholderia heleia]|uniref:hypothetical protein n=1 Tax=Paraburkholderia heleia TaxID=634127 RepID=UPI002AB66F5C|nr:hypothetical protein [Paraburkholderia heleia]